MCFLWSKGFPISGHLPKLSVISHPFTWKCVQSWQARAGVDWRRKGDWADVSVTTNHHQSLSDSYSSIYISVHQSNEYCSDCSKKQRRFLWQYSEQHRLSSNNAVMALSAVQCLEELWCWVELSSRVKSSGAVVESRWVESSCGVKLCEVHLCRCGVEWSWVELSFAVVESSGAGLSRVLAAHSPRAPSLRSCNALQLICKCNALDYVSLEINWLLLHCTVAIIWQQAVGRL